MDSQTIRILLNGEPVEVAGVAPTTSLLAWLRGARGLTGTKEGCNEGDCGACTVVVATLADDGAALELASLNACLCFLPTLDGKAVFTVEHLRSLTGGALHPVQQAFLENDALQCGYCTPGQICSTVGMLQEAADGWASRETADLTAPTALTDAEIRERMSGNICRCSAYPQILAAIRDLAGEPA